MLRHERSDVDAGAGARGRLDAMRLRPEAAGWVPDRGVLPGLEDRIAAPAELPAPAGLPEPPESPEPARSAGPAGPHGAPGPRRGELARAWAADRLPLWAGAELDRIPVRALVVAVTAVIAAILAVVLAWHHGASRGYGGAGSAPGVGPVAPAVPASPPADGVADPTSIVVDVGGRVHKPGLVTLPAGARVADAIAAAGGPLHHREIATVDLAARVSDGQLLLVGVASAPPADAPAAGGDGGDDSTSTATAPVDLDTATIDELETLPGVGPVTAQKIIDWRTAHSGFTTVAQLQQVSGIGPARYAELSPLVTP